MPRRDAPSATAPPQGKPQSARRRGRPPVSSRAAPPRAELLSRPARRASRGSTVPPVFQPAPISSISKEQFPFPPSFQARGPTVCDSLRPHSRPRPILPAVKRVRLGDAMHPHAHLASPYGNSGSSARMSQNAEPSVPSSSTPLRCTTRGTPIVPLEPLARRLEAWLALPTRLVGSRAQFDSATQFSSPGDLPSSAPFSRLRWQLGTPPVLREEIAVLLAKDAIEPFPPAEMRQGFYKPLLHRTQERRWSSTNPGFATSEPGPAQARC